MIPFILLVRYIVMVDLEMVNLSKHKIQDLLNSNPLFLAGLFSLIISNFRQYPVTTNMFQEKNDLISKNSINKVQIYF